MGDANGETRRVAAWAFDQILVMLHPLMPFITEELWQAMGERPYELIVAKWPEPQAQVDRRARDDLNYVINIVDLTRSTRTELNVPPGAHVELQLSGDGPLLSEAMRVIDENATATKRLARVSKFDVSDAPLQESATFILNGVTFRIPLQGVIDVGAEKARLSKAAEAAEKERDSLAQRLANPNFTERAKPEAVEKARADHEAKAAEAERLRAALERLG